MATGAIVYTELKCIEVAGQLRYAVRFEKMLRRGDTHEQLRVLPIFMGAHTASFSEERLA